MKLNHFATDLDVIGSLIASAVQSVSLLTQRIVYLQEITADLVNQALFPQFCNARVTHTIRDS